MGQILLKIVTLASENAGLPQVFANGLAQSRDALDDLLLGHAAVVQTQGVLMVAVGEEGTAGNEGHLLFQALHLQLLGVHILRQHHPGEQAAHGVGEGAALRQLPLQSLQHHLPALVIAGPDGGHMGVQIVHALIEADNYHALQLLEYLYASRVDCIYIDPPYTIEDKSWKYNNDYVDSF